MAEEEGEGYEMSDEAVGSKPTPGVVPDASDAGCCLGNLLFLGVYAAGAALLLYLVVRFVKWAWAG